MSTTKLLLIAIAVIVAGTVPGIDTNLQPGDMFEVDETAAADLVARELAKPADEGAGSEPPPPDDKAAKPKRVKLRLLVDGTHGRCNDVVEVPADEAKALIAAGAADADKKAVAYAEGLKS